MARVCAAQEDMGWNVFARDKEQAAEYSSLQFAGVEGDPRLIPWCESYKAYFYKAYATDSDEQDVFGNFVNNIQAVYDINAGHAVLDHEQLLRGHGCMNATFFSTSGHAFQSGPRWHSRWPFHRAERHDPR